MLSPTARNPAPGGGTATDGRRGGTTAARADALQLNVKVCLVGESAVGKTSLVRRFVLDAYGDAYVSTIGVKVTRKALVVGLPDGRAATVNMLLWDIMGDKGFRDVLYDAYFNGARALLAVVDLTRRSTLSDLAAWIDAAKGVAGPIPVLIAGNKSDLAGKVEIRPGDLKEFAADLGCAYIQTSAKTGENVEGAFRRLAVSIAQELAGRPAGPAREVRVGSIAQERAR
jgi:small GTP-binding protein